MENYRKGKNVEEDLDSTKIPIPNLPENFLWMQVRGGTKIRNVLSYALENFEKAGCIVWTGYGPSVGKAVTCANIMKSKQGNNLHQITKICYRTVEEYWDPIRPELDQLVVKRNLPMIHILLTKEVFRTEELGYQPPNYKVPYRRNENKSNRKNTNNRYPNVQKTQYGRDGNAHKRVPNVKQNKTTDESGSTSKT